jgi:SAM-dependent methyltransferase
VTCGDNNGALNWHIREYGGRWTWAELHPDNLPEMQQLLGDTVHLLVPDYFPFRDNSFDFVVAVDVLEHLDSDQPFLSELYRVLRSNGSALVTVPNGDPRLLANRIKRWLGMTPEVYGHTRSGYTTAELKASVAEAGLAPYDESGYSRFFTEMVELFINFGYVFVLSRKKRSNRQSSIAPATANDLAKHGAAYRFYRLLHRPLSMISKLDKLLPETTNNAVIVCASKAPESE